MLPVILLTLAATAAPPPSAAPAKPPSASAFLKAAAASAPSCRTTRVDDKLVRAALFSTESAKCPVAKVANSETILLGELSVSLEVEHLMRSPALPVPKKRPDMDFKPALDRLISTRLVVLEAREMRLDATPEYRTDVARYQASLERAALQRAAVKGVKPDPAEVQRLYRDAVREWKIKSVLLEKEPDAKAFEAALKSGKSFDALAKQYVAEKKAKGGGPAEFVKPAHMLPEVRAAVEKVKPGVPSGLVKIEAGWVVLRVDGTRYPPNDKMARENARAAAMATAERKAVRAFYLDLKAKYATVDEALLKGLDFEAKGEKGFEELLKDQRPIAKIAGEKPVTVADLARDLSMKFFHGMKSPIEEKRVNVQKNDVFEKLLGSALFSKEAKVRKLDQDPALRQDVTEYERALAFNTFVSTVIVPDIKVTEQEATDYYEAHKADYTAPQMYKLDGIAFPNMRDAQAALEKVNTGTDFNWLRTSAPGQLDPAKQSLRFDGATLSATALPSGLAKALTGSTDGSYRLYAANENEFYVIRVTDEIPPAAQPYVDAREKIAKQLYTDKVVKGINDYAAKLRKAQPVDVLITRISM